MWVTAILVGIAFICVLQKILLSKHKPCDSFLAENMPNTTPQRAQPAYSASKQRKTSSASAFKQ
jgi:hypothetical protein